MVHACNPNTLEGQSGWITWGQEFETSLANMAKPSLYKKYKISQVWWQVPVISATQEATKNIKISQAWWQTACNLSYSRGWGRRIAWHWEAEVTVSQDSATPAWATQPGSVSGEKKKKRSIKPIEKRPGTVAHACNPSTLGGQGRQSINVAIKRNEILSFTGTWIELEPLSSEN